jgi:curved DNA-binding protein CbpA
VRRVNYYEEFGIPGDASAAKIRQAYKTLARVLHPDAHPDEALKAVAERQMRRPERHTRYAARSR